MLAKMGYRLAPDAEAVLREYIALRIAAAALRQRALDPQRARPRAAAPGEPPVRAGWPPGRARRPLDHRRRRHPRQPRLQQLEHRHEGNAMLHGRTTLSKFIIEEQRKLAGGAELIALVNDIQTACKYIASAVARGRADGRARRDRPGQRPGRGAEAARPHRQRHHARQLRVGRLPRRHGLRGDGGALPHPGAVPARPLPAGVRPARRLVEPRRQRHRRHDLLGAARAEGVTEPNAGGLPAAGHAPGLRRLRAVRARGDDRAHAGHRRARLHARPRDRRLHPHPPEPARSPRTRRSSPSTRRTSASGSRRSSATSRSASPAGPARAARTSTCAGSRRWWPRCTGS